MNNKEIIPRDKLGIGIQCVYIIFNLMCLKYLYFLVYVNATNTIVVFESGNCLFLKIIHLPIKDNIRYGFGKGCSVDLLISLPLVKKICIAQSQR